nr:hypothetical protein Q903MT_gene1899 [Picea sitchensis]
MPSMPTRHTRCTPPIIHAWLKPSFLPLYATLSLLPFNFTIRYTGLLRLPPLSLPLSLIRYDTMVTP